MFTPRISRPSRLSLCTAILCLPSLLLSQTPAADPKPQPAAASTYTPHMAFDVSSIRESREGNMSYYDNMATTSYFHGERIRAVGLILSAYDLHITKFIKNLPDWAWNTPFTLTAKSDDSTDQALAKLIETDAYAEKRHMLQLLLADRFHLQIHPETRITTTYELTATDRTSKLMTPYEGDIAKTVGTCNMHYSGKGLERDTKGCPFSILFSDVQQDLGTTILDRTGMSGAYAYHLTYRPIGMPPHGDEELFPALKDALHDQLGLDLKQTKGPVTFWIVDHIERPTPN